jgi:hypothetical protein
LLKKVYYFYFFIFFFSPYLINLDEDVKLAAIKNYSEFLKVFDKEKRENLLEVLVTV